MQTDNSIHRLLTNFSSALRSYEAWCFLVDLNGKNQKIRLTIDNNKLMYHLRFLALKDFFIEIYKVVKDSKSNKDNIFDKLRQYKVQQIDKSVEFENYLIELSNPNLGIKLCTDLRDKYYAHLDEDNQQYLNKIDIDQIHNLIKTLTKILIALVGRERINKQLSFIESREEYVLPNYP